MDCEGLLVYAAKFFCGQLVVDAPLERRGLEGPVEPGHYTTTINVHNPHPRRCAHLRKKAILLFRQSGPDDPATPGIPPDVCQAAPPYEPPMPPGALIQAELRPDWALEIAGREIREELLSKPGGFGPPPPTFITGWVVIEVPASTPLDVVATYTARAFREDFAAPLAMSVDRVVGTLIRD